MQIDDESICAGKEKEISAGKSRDEELVDTVAIASDVMEYTGHVDTHEEDHGDFLTSLGGHIPHLWHDLGKMLTHSLGQNPLGTGTERDSYEYFGMVGKAPYILCPLGFKKNSLGNTIYQPSSDVAPFCKNQHQWNHIAICCPSVELLRSNFNNHGRVKSPKNSLVCWVNTALPNHLIDSWKKYLKIP